MMAVPGVSEVGKARGPPVWFLAADGGGEIEVPPGARVTAAGAWGGVGEKDRLPHDGQSRIVGITPFPQLLQYRIAITDTQPNSHQRSPLAQMLGVGRVGP